MSKINDIINSHIDKMHQLINKLNDINKCNIINTENVILNLDDINNELIKIDIICDNISNNVSLNGDLEERMREYRENDKILREIIPLFVYLKINKNIDNK